jgi:hypothetical protein
MPTKDLHELVHKIDRFLDSANDGNYEKIQQINDVIEGKKYTLQEEVASSKIRNTQTDELIQKKQLIDVLRKNIAINEKLEVSK